MNNFLSFDKMANLLNFIQQGLDIKIPIFKHPLSILIPLLEGRLPGKSIDLGLYSIVNHHVAYLSLSSIDVHFNKS
jgi:hypothetical protein